MNHEQYGRSTASAQYFLQLAGYLGIPVMLFIVPLHSYVANSHCISFRKIVFLY